MCVIRREGRRRNRSIDGSVFWKGNENRPNKDLTARKSCSEMIVQRNISVCEGKTLESKETRALSEGCIAYVSSSSS